MRRVDFAARRPRSSAALGGVAARRRRRAAGGRDVGLDAAGRSGWCCPARRCWPRCAATDAPAGRRRAVAAGAAGGVRRRGAGRLPLAGRRRTPPVLLEDHPSFVAAVGAGRPDVRLAGADPAAPDARATPTEVAALRSSAPCCSAAARSTPRCGPGPRSAGRAPWWRRTARPRPRAAASTTACALDGVGLAARRRRAAADRGTDAVRRLRRRPGADRRGAGRRLVPHRRRRPASTRTAGCRCSAGIDDVVLSGGVNVPAPGGRRAAARAPGGRAGRGARRARRGVGRAAGGVRRRRPVAWTTRRDWVAEEHPRSWAPRQLVRVDADPAAGQRQGRPAWPCGSWPRWRRSSRSRCAPRFRGITVREGVLLARRRRAGASGARSSSTTPTVAAPWLRCAEEAAAGDWPAPVRDRVPVNVTVPAVGPERGRTRSCAPAAARPPRSRWPSPARSLAEDQARRRGGARRARARPAGSGSTPTAAGRSTRPCAAIGALDRAAGGLEYVEQPCADRRGAGRRPPPGRRADRGRRVDPAGRGPLPGARPRGRRHRRAQGAAARRRPRLPADRRGDRAAGRGLVGAGDLGRDRGRARAGRGAARAALRVRPGDRAAADRRRRRRPAAAGRRHAAGRLPRSTRARSTCWRRPATGWRTGRRGWPRVRVARDGSVGR